MRTSGWRLSVASSAPPQVHAHQREGGSASGHTRRKLERCLLAEERQALARRSTEQLSTYGPQAASWQRRHGMPKFLCRHVQASLHGMPRLRLPMEAVLSTPLFDSNEEAPSSAPRSGVLQAASDRAPVPHLPPAGHPRASAPVPNLCFSTCMRIHAHSSKAGPLARGAALPELLSEALWIWKDVILALSLETRQVSGVQTGRFGCRDTCHGTSSCRGLLGGLTRCSMPVRLAICKKATTAIEFVQQSSLDAVSHVCR